MRNTISLPNITISRDGVVLFASQFVQIWIDFSVANKSLYYMSPFPDLSDVGFHLRKFPSFPTRFLTIDFNLIKV